jgi:hypothetical protein
VVPLATSGSTGSTVIDLKLVFVTVNELTPVIPWSLALTVVAPAPLPAANPLVPLGANRNRRVNRVDSDRFEVRHRRAATTSAGRQENAQQERNCEN